MDLGIAFSISGNELSLQRQKGFVQNFLKSFKISRDKTRLGFMNYGRQSKTLYKLGDIENAGEAETAIQSVTTDIPAGSNLQSVLEHARTEFFQPINGARVSVPKSLFVFVGKKNGEVILSDVKKEMDQLKEMDVRMVFVGIDDDVTLVDQLKTLDPEFNAFFFADTLPKLEKQLQPITRQLLPGLYYFSFFLIYISVHVLYTMRNILVWY